MIPIPQNWYVSWKTSIAGLSAGLCHLGLALQTHDWVSALHCLAAIATALAGLYARDGDKSSEDTGAKGAVSITMNDPATFKKIDLVD